MEILDYVKEFFGIAVGIAGVVALFYAAHGYRTSKKQLSFAVIVSCTDRFQQIMPLLNSPDPLEKSRATRQYVDLCHEELFYFMHGYLPEEIIDEWLDGMVYYFPHFNGHGQTNTEQEFLLTLENDILHGYPRIRHCFSLEEEFKLSDPSARRKLVRKIKSRLASYQGAH